MTMKKGILFGFVLVIGAMLALGACSSNSETAGEGSDTTVTTEAGGGSDTTVTTEAGGGSNTTVTTKAGGSTDTTKPSAPAKSYAVVEEMQKSLKELGYYDGSVDGIYGAQTTDAVKKFQTDSGITADGRWGPETNAAINAALGTDSKSDAIAELQVELRSLGYYDGEIDGLYGEATTIAVTKAQEACGIELDGIYGPETHDCIIGLSNNA